MKRIQAIIVDDEPLDRDLLRHLVQAYCPDIEIVGETDDGTKALAMIASLEPDLVFLDIQMRGETGFDILERLPATHRAKIVFTTGFEHYGIKAVKAGAFDYLLKPIDINELEMLQQKLLQAMSSAPAGSFITLYNKGMQQVVYFNDIAFLQAQGSYTKLVFQDGSHLLTAKNLKQLQEELPQGQFIKVHRSVVVNAQQISGFKNLGNEGLLLLRNGLHVPVSRGYKNNLQQYLH
jgi:two-component system, LytTR family, response regulator